MTATGTAAPARLARATGRATSFWVFAAAGIVVLSFAWCWYGLAQMEAETEQSKALAAGQTMDGFALWFGGVPLIVAHLIDVAILLPLGWRRWRGRGVAYGLIAVVIASAVGIGVGELLFVGDLFNLGLHRYNEGI